MLADAAQRVHEALAEVGVRLVHTLGAAAVALTGVNGTEFRIEMLGVRTFASHAASAASHLSAVATYVESISVRREAPSLSLNSLAELKS